jgi:hypothetical protein
LLLEEVIVVVLENEEGRVVLSPSIRQILSQNRVKGSTT